MADPQRSDAAPVAERVLWSTRLLILGGVAGSALLAAAVIWLATVDLVRFGSDVVDYTAAEDASSRPDLIGEVVKIVDTYLLAAILVVVTFGLYELFVGRIDAGRTGDGAPRLLVARSLDDLKDSIAKLVVLILVIEFAQRVLKADIERPADLLLLAGGIALVSLAVVLPSAAEHLRRGGRSATSD